MKRFFKKLFTKNWELKLISLILALILWVILIPEEKIFSEKKPGLVEINKKAFNKGYNFKGD